VLVDRHDIDAAAGRVASMSSPLSDMRRSLKSGQFAPVHKSLNKALIDGYCCPDSFAEFEATAPLSQDTGYFRFGKNTICYGRSASGFRSRRADGRLYDVLNDVIAGSSTPRLPFDPTEVIDNLRLERYANHHHYVALNRWKRSLRNAYYFLRPLMHVNVRRRVQRAHLNGWKNILFPRWPVDTTVEDLSENLLRLSMQAKGVDRVPFIWFWPDGAQSCVTMTHDIETEKGKTFCSELMRIDNSFGIKASFQVVPEGRYEVSAAFLENICHEGFEVNIQDLNHDGHLFRDRQEFLRRAEKINEYGRIYDAKGFRAAVLYRNLAWYDALQFSFDMSVPNVAHLDPQRGGCCTVMPYFVGDTLEIPLTTTQDYMLFHLLNDYSLDLWKAQTDLIVMKNGLVSFLVHPDYIIEKSARDAYCGLLRFLCQLSVKKKMWFATAGEIDGWWRARREMCVVNYAGKYRIEGRGSQRAKLAFAKVVGDHLEYEMDSR
jgi:hypothetical protein